MKNKKIFLALFLTATLLLLPAASAGASVEASMEETSTEETSAEEMSAEEISIEEASAEELLDLGKQYLLAEDEEQDYEKALEYFTAAAEKGSAPATINLAQMYDFGFGMEHPDHGKAASLYEQYLEMEDAQDEYKATAMWNLAIAYFYGEGVPIDYARAFELISQSEELEDIDDGDKDLLGMFYEYGFGVVDVDYAKAIDKYEQAAEAGNPEAMYSLAQLYENGRGVEKDDAKAQELYKQAESQITQYSEEEMPSNWLRVLGMLYVNGYGVEQDAEKGVELLTAAAEQEDWYAAAELGKCYYNGQGVEQDYGKAFEYNTLAADHGILRAITNVGVQYDSGNGVEQNRATAAEYYQKAADLGFPYAMIYLGDMYMQGEGVEQDYAKTKELFEKAAALDCGSAMNNLGYIYEQGYGVEQDYSKAMELYEKAAAKGEVNAIYNLGVMYENGTGVDVDIDKACEWYQKAADLGDPDAPADLERLRAESGQETTEL